MCTSCMIMLYKLSFFQRFSPLFFQKTNLATESPITIFHLNDIISNKMLASQRTLLITAAICAAVPKLLSVRVFAISTQQELILYCETMSINRKNQKQLAQETADIIHASTVMHKYTHHGRYANSLRYVNMHRCITTRFDNKDSMQLLSKILFTQFQLIKSRLLNYSKHKDTDCP